MPVPRLLPAALAPFVALVLLMACGEGQEAPLPTPTPLAESPEDVFRAVLDAFNRSDADGFFALLSQEAQRSISLEDLRRIIEGNGRGATPISVTLDRVDKQTITGGSATMEVTLSIHLGEHVVTVEDVASFVREEDQWRIPNHFLETGVTALGKVLISTGGPRQLGPDGCATGDALQGVHAPFRLHVLDPCVTVTGTVRDISRSGDGDMTFRLELSGEDRRLLNEGNERHFAGALQVEIVPLDRVQVPVPKVGDRVRVTGAWVFDAGHGWNEIHPVFRLEIVEE